MSKNKVLKFILVNLLTLTRIIGAVIMPISYFKNGIGMFSLFVCLIFFTDFLDGKLSRYWKVESFLGSLADSVGDKLFAFSMILILANEYPLILVIFALEIYIFISGILSFSQNKNVQSSKMGKRKTFILDISISIMFIYLARDIYSSYISTRLMDFLNNSEEAVVYSLIGIMIGLELLTIADYTIKHLKKVSLKNIRGKKLKSTKEITYMLINREYYIENRDKSLRELMYK